MDCKRLKESLGLISWVENVFGCFRLRFLAAHHSLEHNVLGGLLFIFWSLLCCQTNNHNGAMQIHNPKTGPFPGQRADRKCFLAANFFYHSGAWQNKRDRVQTQFVLVCVLDVKMLFDSMSWTGPLLACDLLLLSTKTFSCLTENTVRNGSLLGSWTNKRLKTLHKCYCSRLSHTQIV